ncbi:carbohydrate ABC transporter permease [Streptomyces ipomoeae]|uniref:carbohydrate ABC transporter permease n=1 Tax=Streptomyces ipomoeae TaxID=103232 RepID=UPI0011478BD5|nr:carbohydrate ABC transporter permease [Streptomyces ipomoeae]MDX2938413.1 carbohydrate ABC transporter permease [Streptomyces ipomoeae]TQE23770.1 carbohydrate ABC transporter permease [Streptomyces ipomoeae]
MTTTPLAPAVQRSVRRRRIRQEWGRPWLYLPLSGLLLLMVTPFLWMLSGSFKPEADIRKIPPDLIPTRPTLTNFQELFDSLDFTRMFANSVIVALAVTAGNLIFCSMLGYALAKLEFRGQRAVFTVVIATLMVPGLVTFVPLYVLVANMKLTGSLLGLILPFLATPFGVFLMRQFISTLPDELIDAARVDGCRELAIFWKIILPLTKPALATLGIITFLGSWNNFLWPLVVAQNESQYTLPVGLALASSGQDFTRFGILLAGAVVVLLPVTIVFLLFQRHFVAGIATTGLK